MIIRPIISDDLESLIPLHLASRLTAEQGIIRDSDLHRDDFLSMKTLWEKWMLDDTMYKICVVDDKIIKGFCLYGRVKTRPSFDRGVVPKFGAEIYGLYVDPTQLRQGIGRFLIHNAMNDLISQKHTGLILWAFKKNKNATAFYKSMGAEIIGKKRIEIGESSWADDNCFAWKNIKTINL